MADYVEAVFQHGAFVPETPCDLPEGTKVTLKVEPRSGVMPPRVTDPEERARIMTALLESFRRNPIPEGAPARFSRDEMHERR